MKYTSLIIVWLFILSVAVQPAEASCGDRWDQTGADSAALNSVWVRSLDPVS